jgi:hypothetical protein
MNEWSCTSTPPYVFMVWSFLEHKDRFTFAFIESKWNASLQRSLRGYVGAHLGFTVPGDTHEFLKSYGRRQQAQRISMGKTKAYPSRHSAWLCVGLQRGGSSSLGRVKNFLFSMSSRPVVGPTQPPVGTKGSFPGGKAAGAWSWILTSN